MPHDEVTLEIPLSQTGLQHACAQINKYLDRPVYEAVAEVDPESVRAGVRRVRERAEHRDPRDVSNIDEALRCVNWEVCGREDAGSGWCSDECHQAFLVGHAQSTPPVDQIASAPDTLVRDEPRFEVAKRKLLDTPRLGLARIAVSWNSAADEYLWTFTFRNASATPLNLVLDRSGYAVLDAGQLVTVFTAAIDAYLVQYWRQTYLDS